MQLKLIVVAPIWFALLAALTCPGLAQFAPISHFVAPTYPPLARSAAMTGRADLTIRIAKDGSVTIPEASGSHEFFLEPAKRCVTQWKFFPGSTERTIHVIVYYGFSGNTRDVNPNTSVTADFISSTIAVYVVTDPPPQALP